MKKASAQDVGRRIDELVKQAVMPMRPQPSMTQRWDERQACNDFGKGKDGTTRSKGYWLDGVPRSQGKSLLKAGYDAWKSQGHISDGPLDLTDAAPSTAFVSRPDRYRLHMQVRTDGRVSIVVGSPCFKDTPAAAEPPP